MGIFVGLRISRDRMDAVALKTSGNDKEIIEKVAAKFDDDDSMMDGIREYALRFEQHPVVWCIGLPTEEFSFRHVTFPFRKPKAIRNAIVFTLEPLLPYPAEEVECSYVRISSSGDETKVLACAIQKERLEHYKGILEKAGIKARIITPDVSALYNVYKKIGVSDGEEEKTAPTLLANVDNDSMLVCYAGDNGFVDYFASSPDENEMERFLAAFDEKPESILITGEKSLGFKQFPSQQNLSSNENLKAFYGGTMDADDAIIPFGLALHGMEGAKKGFNFSGDAAHFGKFPAKLRPAVVGAAVILILGIGFMFYRNHVKFDILRETKAQTSSAFKAALPDARAVKPAFQLKQRLKELKLALKRSGIVGSERIDILWILKSIAEAMPKGAGTDLDEIIYEPESVIIKGTTESFESVNNIRDSLTKISAFKKIEVTDTQAVADGKQVSFKLKGAL